MSAVGLLLLEDPKARARAEARIRNGGGGRRSFFGRPGAASNKGRKPNLPPTILDEDLDADPVIVRPDTSLNLPLTTRKKSEPSDRSSSRNSIFGRKGSIGDLSIRSGASGSSKNSAAVSAQSYATHITEPDPHAHLKEHINSSRSIPPQGSRVNGLPLDPVQERVVPDVNAEGGSRTDTLGELESDGELVESRPMSPISINPPSLPPAARISRFDETMFSEVANSADPSDAARIMQLHKQALRDPERFSDLVVTKEQRERSDPLPRLPNQSEGPRETSQIHSAIGRSQLSKEVSSHEPGTSAPGSNMASAENTIGWEQPALTTRPRHPLPLLPAPGQFPTAKASDSSLGTSSCSSGVKSYPAIRVQPVSTSSRARDSQTAESPVLPPTLSFSSDVRESMVFTDSTWEDDIDFVYEHGAEAACDFEWDFAPRERNSAPSRSDGGSRVSEAYLYGQAPSFRSDVSRRDSRTLSGGDTCGERRSKKTSFVGHRGFAAARNSAEEQSLPKPLPGQLNGAQPLKEDLLSPNIVDMHDGPPISPTALATMDFPLPPSRGPRFSDNLSDPESWRNSSSKHRKSSSYGSLESFARTSVATSGRWSMASDMPALVHSRPKRTCSLSRSQISAPLEVLTQQPQHEKAFEVEDRPDELQNFQPLPEEEEFVLRRPRTSGERKLLQAAGRQRYRMMPNVAPAVHSGRLPVSTTSSNPWI